MVFLNAYSIRYKRSYFNVRNVMSEKHGVTDKSYLRGESIQGCSTSARSRSYGKKTCY